MVGYNTGSAGDNWLAATLAAVYFIGNYRVATKLNFNYRQSGGSCQSLPGCKQRIFFGYPSPSNFGLGMELVDKQGNSIGGSFQDVAAFPNGLPEICLPLATGNTSVSEQWGLVNLTGEDHNSHIHQTKFRVLTDGELTAGLSNLSAQSILQDSVPLLTGSAAYDGTVATWRIGGCQTAPVTVQIPFTITGNFVYHCHILEYEDNGMMANIHIVSAGQ